MLRRRVARHRPPGYDADAGGLVTCTEDREACEDRNALRNLDWGDLHVHTDLSFDACARGVRNSPDQAYRFATGESVGLPPRTVRQRNRRGDDPGTGVDLAHLGL